MAIASDAIGGAIADTTPEAVELMSRDGILRAMEAEAAYYMASNRRATAYDALRAQLEAMRAQLDGLMVQIDVLAHEYTELKVALKAREQAVRESVRKAEGKSERTEVPGDAVDTSPKVFMQKKRDAASDHVK